MRKLWAAIKGISGASYVNVGIGIAVLSMLAVGASQVYQAGMEKGFKGRQSEVDAANTAVAACASATSAYKTSLLIQNDLAQAIIKDGEALRATAAAAKQSTDRALQESAGLRKRLRDAAARPAAGDVAVDALNKEAWEAVRCARGSC